MTDPVILVLSVSDIARDPRVSRIARALADVAPTLAIGTEGDAVAGVTLRTIPAPRFRLRDKAGTALRQMPARLAPGWARRIWRLDPASRAMMRATEDLRPRLIWANDLATLPLAVAIAGRSGARVVYDSHEFATGEGEHKWLWRLVFQAYRRELERACIARADAVVTVSPGLARLLQSLYGLAETPRVIRNMPAYHEAAYRAPGETVTALYHGLYLPERGLDALIDSVAHWRDGTRLVLRGYGPAGYEAALRARAQAVAAPPVLDHPEIRAALRARARAVAPDRITFADPVRTQDLVAAAEAADIGILPFPLDRAQQRYSLPNKLFEYAMAGLAIATTPCDDIADLVRAHGMGAVAEAATPDAIARAVNALTGPALADAKRAALAAARILNWDRESEAVRGLAAELLAR